MDFLSQIVRTILQMPKKIGCSQFNGGSYDMEHARGGCGRDMQGKRMSRPRFVVGSASLKFLCYVSSIWMTAVFQHLY